MLMTSPTKLSIISPIAPTVMSQLQKSNPFGELSALAARIKLKATIIHVWEQRDTQTCAMISVEGAIQLEQQRKTMMAKSILLLINIATKAAKILIPLIPPIQ
ncbi:5228_t:CDS:2 [Entrophospora sp. SA101]|nr:21962_t:CDS:2 [Entrophospora sp. SA101]CAJ0748419.1 10907_t:CDS:2 [Entrophospora sp. SA101]CAJ0766231.1 5228_t:CDS:2 [Entrophospora sp. SA101]